MKSSNESEAKNQQSENEASAASVLPEYPRIYIPDYTRELQFLNKLILQFLNSDHQQEIEACMQRIEKKVDAIPEVIPVKNHHHLEIRSVAFLVTVGLMLVALITATVFYNSKQELSEENAVLQRENAVLKSDTLSYFLIKAYFPGDAKAITQKFNADPSGYTNQAQALIKTRATESKRLINHSKHNNDR